jgi:hypothetical protein
LVPKFAFRVLATAESLNAKSADERSASLAEDSLIRIAPSRPNAILAEHMDTPDQPQAPLPRTTSISAEAIVGIGITLGALGVLGLLLGWAQWMRLVHDSALAWLITGAVLVLIGVITAVVGQSRRRRA